MQPERKAEMDIPLANALLLWNAGWKGKTPAFIVRPLGHQDYDHYDFQVGACFREWQEKAATDPAGLRLQAMIDIWHIAAFYEVPVSMIAEGMLVVPEYRDMLADDCLPKRFQHERD
jgi:hypothetical protein